MLWLANAKCFAVMDFKPATCPIWDSLKPKEIRRLHCLKPTQKLQVRCNKIKQKSRYHLCQFFKLKRNSAPCSHLWSVKDHHMIKMNKVQMNCTAFSRSLHLTCIAPAPSTSWQDRELKDFNISATRCTISVASAGRALLISIYSAIIFNNMSPLPRAQKTW